MPNVSGRNLAVLFVAGIVVGGIAVYLGLTRRPVVVPPPPPPPALVVAPCGQGTGKIVVTTRKDPPYVDCVGVELKQNDTITWQKGNDVNTFVVDFKKAKPFKDKNNNDKGHFTEQPDDSSGTAKDPCPGVAACDPYFPYSVSVNGAKPFDPGVIITKP